MKNQTQKAPVQGTEPMQAVNASQISSQQEAAAESRKSIWELVMEQNDWNLTIN